MTEFSMNSATPDFPAEDAPQTAVLDNAPPAPVQPLGTEMHQDQAAQEAKEQEAAKAAEAEAAKEAKKAEKPSLDEAMAKAEAKLKAKAEADAKAKEADPKAEVKPEPKARAEDGKFAPNTPKPEGTETVVTEQPKVTHPAPARFDDVAKADWDNTPESVRGATNRTIKELTDGIQRYKADADEFSQVREFHELAKNSGTTLNQALSNYVNAERMLRSNPDAGLSNLLKTVDIKPMDAIMSILRANNTTPQQLAEAITKNPQAFNRPAPARPDPSASQALTEVQQLRRELQESRAEAEIVAPFRAAHPRYDALQADIAINLSSGNIPKNLPPRERLQMAYDMAEEKAKSYVNLFAGAQTASNPPLAQTQTQKPAVNPAGLKSISGAPSPSSTNTAVKKKGPLPSIDESLKRAAARR